MMTNEFGFITKITRKVTSLYLIDIFSDFLSRFFSILSFLVYCVFRYLLSPHFYVLTPFLLVFLLHFLTFYFTLPIYPLHLSTHIYNLNPTVPFHSLYCPPPCYPFLYLLLHPNFHVRPFPPTNLSSFSSLLSSFHNYFHANPWLTTPLTYSNPQLIPTPKTSFPSPPLQRPTFSTLFAHSFAHSHALFHHTSNFCLCTFKR